MKNKLVFRILGALASSLIIVSVFVPFVSVIGYSQSLWQAHQAVGTLYLPIMIIVFGLIGLIVFSINIKTELAYTSSGALLFFLITQTIPIIDQGTFNTLGVGYYCLAIGTIITGIMAFLCNLREKKVVLENSQVEEANDVSLLNEIDKLYDNQVETNRIEDNNIIQPLPIENNIKPIEIVQPTIPVEPMPIQAQTIQTETVQPVISNNIPVSKITNNSIDNIVASPIQDNNLNIPDSNLENTTIINPVVSEFNTAQSENPTTQFNTPQEATIVQPVEYSNVQNTQFNQNLNESEFTQQPNPVVSEFSASKMFTPSETLMENENIFTQQDMPNKDNNLDIFG